MLMKTFKYIIPLAAIALVTGCQNVEKQKATIPPPVAEKVAHEFKENGGSRVDNYYWMKLSDEQKNAVQKDEQTQKVLTYLTAENDYLKASLAHTDSLASKIYR